MGKACSLASPKPLTGFPVQRTPSSGNVALTVTPRGKDTPGAKTRKQAPTGTPEDRPAPTGTPRDRPAPTGTPGQTSPQWDPRIDQPPMGPHVATPSSPLRAHTSALCLPVGGILMYLFFIQTHVPGSSLMCSPCAQNSTLTRRTQAHVICRYTSVTIGFYWSLCKHDMSLLTCVVMTLSHLDAFPP